MKRKIFITLICLAAVLPAFAVFNEKNISQTISVLRHELHMTCMAKTQQDKRHEQSYRMAEVQHQDMVNTVRWINELTLILYSQESGFTLDRAYAMNCVMYEYDKFNQRRRPQYNDIGVIDTEIGRYQRLIEALRLLPPRLEEIAEVPDTLRTEIDDIDIQIENLNQQVTLAEDSLDVEDATVASTSVVRNLVTYVRNARKEAANKSDGSAFLLSVEAQADRDSCIAYAKEIVQSYTRQKERIEEDEYYFTEMKKKVQQTYEYAQECFEDISTGVFVTGQENYFHILANLRRYAADTAADMAQKYGTGDSQQDRDGLYGSQWRGVALAGTVLYSMFHLLIISLLVVLLFCVVLKNFRPFNTEWFRQTRPVTLMLAISLAYSLLISVSMMFPMNNFMFIAAVRLLIFFWFVIALLLSILIRIDKEKVRNGFEVFVPVMALGMILLLFRAVFLPDKMIHLSLPPILALTLLWQIFAARKFKASCGEYKNICRLQYVTVGVIAISLAAALYGYSLLAMMFLMWWIFQVATIATLISIVYLFRYFDKKVLSRKKEAYAAANNMVSKDEDGDFIRVTWLYDFFYRAALPMVAVWSMLGCIWLAFGVFDLNASCHNLFHKAFFDFSRTDGTPVLQISIFKLASVCSSFFLYKYLYYLVRSIYRTFKFEKVMKERGNNIIRKNDINLTLAYNVIGIIIWGMFIIYSINVLKIPLGAVSIVAAGLATGLGLALKDVLNNFIYGIQLMSGRLRVGDMLKCDGVSGTVEKISYQSTEIQTIEGAVISFTNSTLFNKNFQNLTRNSPYELICIKMSISYGEDVQKVRSLILGGLAGQCKKKDKYGRFIVEKRGGIWITLEEFGDSSVDIAIKQRVLVESKYAYIAEVKEQVYRIFNENGITIPFPQQEVSILNFPKK